MTDTGWIKLHRALLDKPIWKFSTSAQKTILITLLLMANHESNEWDWGGKRFNVQKGEFVTSLESIRKSAGRDIGIQQIRTAIGRFKNLEFLTYKATKHGRIITICNWEKYQAIIEPQQQSNQQTGNKRVTTNKNDKNEKNIYRFEKKVSLPKNFALTGQMKNYCAKKRWTQNPETEFERFVTYCKQEGKKYQDWYAAFQKWVQNDIKWHPAHQKKELVEL